MKTQRPLIFTLLMILQLGLSQGATAEWTVYLAGELGVASGSVDGGGLSSITSPERAVGADYSDSSPLMGGALGITSPINELTPWELPYDLRLPAWPLSLEVEATGLRSFEGIQLKLMSFEKSAGSTEAWSVMFNLWQDFPLQPLSRPLASLFGRLPNFVTDMLDRTTVRGGGGVGITGWEYLFFDTFHIAGSEAQNFAWQAGAGMGYDLSDVVNLGLGYRYFDYGETDSPIHDNASIRGVYFIKQTSHEFRARLTFAVYSFAAPWRR